MIKFDSSLIYFDLNKAKHKNHKLIDNVYNEVMEFSNNDNIYSSGWLNWPNKEFYDNDYVKINHIYDLFKRKNINKIVVIGIGGSYIGVKACIDMFKTYQNKDKIIFLSNCNEHYLNDVLKSLENQNWGLIVISKSGTTLETAINFRFLREHLVKTFKDDYKERLVTITDDNHGILSNLADIHNYNKLSIPSNIGGRYSTLTSVGLLTMKLMDINIDEILNGYNETIINFKNKKNLDPLDYAFIRYYLLTEYNKQVEVFITYDNRLRFISEHYKQIFAETEGKKKECIIPTIANFSDDLHSIGQLYQEGNNNFFETILFIENHKSKLLIPKSSFNNDDQLDYLTNLNINDFEKMLIEAATNAHHQEAKINCLKIKMDTLNEFNFGALIAFLNLSACCSACFLNVNPFDQPGVEQYKTNLKSLLKYWAKK